MRFDEATLDDDELLTKLDKQLHDAFTYAISMINKRISEIDVKAPNINEHIFQAKRHALVIVTF